MNKKINQSCRKILHSLSLRSAPTCIVTFWSQDYMLRSWRDIPWGCFGFRRKRQPSPRSLLTFQTKLYSRGWTFSRLLWSATFEQLLASGATFCGSSNLEQILPFWATFEQNIGFRAHIKHEKATFCHSSEQLSIILRAQSGKVYRSGGFIYSLQYNRLYTPYSAPKVRVPCNLKH